MILSISHKLCTHYCCALFSWSYIVVCNAFIWFIFAYSSCFLNWDWARNDKHVPTKLSWKLWVKLTNTKQQSSGIMRTIVGIYCIHCSLKIQHTYIYDEVLPFEVTRAVIMIASSYLFVHLTVWHHDGSPGGRLNKKEGLSRYGDSHVKDKTS